jgi:hypothetical protein
MLHNQLIQLKARIEHEERLYRTELKTTQRFENLKAIRLRISTLKQQLSKLEGNQPIEGLPSI